MSIRNFHIVFVLVSSMLMLFISGWSLYNWDYYADNTYLTYLTFSILSLILLLLYGMKFLNKTTKL